MNEKPGEREKEPRLSEALKKALRDRSVPDTITALRGINKELTGSESLFIDEKEVREFFDKMERGPRSEPFLKIYLGDGGISRLIVEADGNGDIKTRLSPNSSESAVNKWKNI